MNATKIEYLQFTWSPLVGCSGKNCAVHAKCWAKYQAKRRRHKCQQCYDFIPHEHLTRLDQPSKIKTPKKIGVCFSADFWDPGFTKLQRSLVINCAAFSDWHTYINLTKQPQNIPEDLQLPDNWIQGVSVCNKADLWRIDTLRRVKAAHKMISFEPLYEDLGSPDLTGIDWVIIGGQTHPEKQPNPFWIQNIVEAAIKLDIPFFIKNNIKTYVSIQKYPKFLWGKHDIDHMGSRFQFSPGGCPGVCGSV